MNANDIKSHIITIRHSIKHRHSLISRTNNINSISAPRSKDIASLPLLGYLGEFEPMKFGLLGGNEVKMPPFNLAEAAD
jgi:hypothetical protein